MAGTVSIDKYEIVIQFFQQENLASRSIFIFR